MNGNFIEGRPGEFIVRVPEIRRNPDGSIPPEEMKRVAQEFKKLYSEALNATARGKKVKYVRAGAQETDQNN